MCIWSIELIWVSTYGKMEEKHTFYVFLETFTGTQAMQWPCVTPHPEMVYDTCNRRVAYVHQGLP